MSTAFLLLVAHNNRLLRHSAAAIARLTEERNTYAKRCANLLNETERLRSEKETFERWYADAVGEVARLRDELEWVSK